MGSLNNVCFKRIEFKNIIFLSYTHLFEENSQ